MKASNARLFIAFSDDPTRTLVLRRGPAKHIATFNWDRTTDTFTLGQWLKGRIYEHRLDVSPDGKHWIYLALQGGFRTHTVVARSPFMKAIDFHPWSGTWGGGGKFLSSRSYMLAGNLSGQNRRVSGQFKIVENNTIAALGLFSRLRRQGWDYMLNGDFTRKADNGWVLRKHVGNGRKYGRSGESEWHTLVHKNLGISLKRPSWEWADVDQNGILFAEGGKLMRAELSRDADKPYKEALVHDFNTYVFEQIRAPY